MPAVSVKLVSTEFPVTLQRLAASSVMDALVSLPVRGELFFRGTAMVLMLSAIISPGSVWPSAVRTTLPPLDPPLARPGGAAATSAPEAAERVTPRRLMTRVVLLTYKRGPVAPVEVSEPPL